MIEHDQILIGTRWTRAQSDRTLSVHSPATGELVGRVPLASAADVDAAVGAARRAFDEGPWPWLATSERAELVASFAAALEPLGAVLDETVSLESGLPICFGNGRAGLDMLDYYVGLGQTFAVEEHRPGRPDGGSVLVRYCPGGVVAAIVPWNGPVNLALAKLVPALIAGCTVLVKTAPETPLSSYRVADALVAAGIPDGVVSILPGDRDTGAALVRHPGVDRVSFTGSTAAGAEIAAECGRALRRVNLELGGKSAAILLEDVDPDGLATALTCGLFFNGEACSALTRLLVPKARYAELVDRTVAHVEGLPVGDPLDPSTFIGPMVSERQRAKVEEYVALGRQEGARLVAGGRRPPGLDAGWYVEPTVFADVDNDMRVAREEVFGPLLCLI